MDAPVSAKAALLQALGVGPGFGLDLIERVRERTNGLVELHQGSIYPALRALKNDGLVHTWTGECAEQGGRPRRYYELTAEGRQRVEQDRRALAGLYNLRLPETP